MSQAQADNATMADIDTVIRKCGHSLANDILPVLDQLPTNEVDNFMLQVGCKLDPS